MPQYPVFFWNCQGRTIRLLKIRRRTYIVFYWGSSSPCKHTQWLMHRLIFFGWCIIPTGKTDIACTILQALKGEGEEKWKKESKIKELPGH